MRIGIDARMIGQSGIGRYIEHLLCELATLDQESAFVLFLRSKKELPVKAKNFLPVIANIPWYSLQEQIKLTVMFQKAKLDLLHVPHFNVPLFYRGRFIVTIHDLTHTKMNLKRATTLTPWLYRAKRVAYARVLRHAISDSENIITVSESVKKEILHIFDVPASKIVITPEAVDQSFCRQKTNRVIEQPYIFYVGNAHPHKNIERLISAFCNLPQKVRVRYRLVLAGREHYFWQRIAQETKERKEAESVIFLHDVDDHKLQSLYQHATAFAFPSLSEGFGLPVLEAMQCGCPVVASNIPTIREVAGTLPIYVDGTKEKEIARGLLVAMHLTEGQRHAFATAAAKYVKAFSWKKMAASTLALYRQQAQA